MEENGLEQEEKQEEQLKMFEINIYLWGNSIENKDKHIGRFNN